MKEDLQGGRNNIARINNKVHRPANKWTDPVHDFLRYLHNRDFPMYHFPTTSVMMVLKQSPL